jgi:hypothetical protein
MTMSKQPDRPIGDGSDNDLNLATFVRSYASATEDDDVQGHRLDRDAPEDEDEDKPKISI